MQVDRATCLAGQPWWIQQIFCWRGGAREYAEERYEKEFDGSALC